MNSSKLPSHSQKVYRLYKKALRTVFDRAEDREQERLYGLAIRAAFDKRAKEENPQKISAFLRATEELLEYWRHDDPYIYPLSSEGFLSEREPEFSQQVLEYGHRKLWGGPPSHWQSKMREYENSLLYDKSQHYYNTPIVPYDEEEKAFE